MTHHRIPLSTLRLFSDADVAEAERQLAELMEMRDAEEDPAWRAELDEWIESDTAWLAEMQEAVRPRLRLVLPIGLPAPPSITANTR